MQLPKCLLPLLALLFVVKFRVSDEAYVKPGCRDSCGNVSISYPFGIGANCSFDPWFEIECKPHAKFNKPFLRKLDIEVLGSRSGSSSYQTNDPDPSDPYLTVGLPPHNSCTSDQQLSSIDLTGIPYWFSTANLFLMDGCPGSAPLVNGSNTILGSCATICHTSNNNYCTVHPDIHDCCSSSLKAYDVKFFLVKVYDVKFERPPIANTCLLATLVSSDYAEDYVGGLLNNPIPSSSLAPVQLSWAWGNDNYAIFPNTSCDVFGSCYCDSCFNGDAYVPGGCIGCVVPHDEHKTDYLGLLNIFGFIVLLVDGKV